VDEKTVKNFALIAFMLAKALTDCYFEYVPGL
jgi:hypothetical protein